MKLPLSNLEVFNLVFQRENMREVAKYLGVEPSTISHQIKALEKEMGVTLFIRSTRSIKPTEAGRVLAAATRPAFAEISEGVKNAQNAGKEESGILKLNVPEFAFLKILNPILPDFLTKYPDIEVELNITDAMSDILDEDTHAGFRFGHMIDDQMIAKQVSEPINACLAATPKYLEKWGTPQVPQDLLHHNCLRYRFLSSKQIIPWMFEKDGETINIAVKGNYISNSLQNSLELGLAGAGIFYGFYDYAADAIKDGKLIPFMEDYQCNRPAIHIYYPPEYRNYLPLKLLVGEFLGN